MNLRTPTGGENIKVYCRICEYRGTAKLAGLPGIPSHTLKSDKCPKCNQKALAIDYAVM